MKIMKLFVAVAAVLSLGLLAACGSTEDDGAGSNTGTVKVTMQDAPAVVEKLEVTVQEVAIHFVPKAQQVGEDTVVALDTVAGVDGPAPMDTVAGLDTQDDTALVGDTVDGDTGASYKNKSKKPDSDVVSGPDTTVGPDVMDDLGGQGDILDSFTTPEDVLDVAAPGPDTFNGEVVAVAEGGDGDVVQAGEISDEEPAEESSDPNKAGWRVVLKGPRVFDLIALKDNPTELGLLTLGPGKITQVRLVLAEENAATVTVDGTQHPVTVASGVIKLTGNFDIVAGQETAVKLDFDAEESLKQNGQGEYRLHPVVKILD